MYVVLSDLRFHWSGAYVLCSSLGRYTATRRDNGVTLSADDPEVLRRLIRADYFQQPVLRTGARPGRHRLKAVE